MIPHYFLCKIRIVSTLSSFLLADEFRSMSYATPRRPIAAPRALAPSQLESQIFPLGDSPSALPRELRLGQWNSRNRLSITNSTNPDPLHQLSLGSRNVGGGSNKHDNRNCGGGGGGDISVTGVSVVSTRSMIQGSVITFRDVEYVVPVKKTPCSKAVKKVVLDGVRYPKLPIVCSFAPN